VGIHYQLIEDKLNLVKLQKAKFLEHALQMELLRKKIDLTNKKLEKKLYKFIFIVVYSIPFC
jgi:hypothetical protein